MGTWKFNGCIVLMFTKQLLMSEYACFWLPRQNLSRAQTRRESDMRRQGKVEDGEWDGPVEKEKGERESERGREAISSRYPPISQMGHLVGFYIWRPNTMNRTEWDQESFLKKYPNMLCAKYCVQTFLLGWPFLAFFAFASVDCK